MTTIDLTSFGVVGTRSEASWGSKTGDVDALFHGIAHAAVFNASKDSPNLFHDNDL